MAPEKSHSGGRAIRRSVRCGQIHGKPAPGPDRSVEKPFYRAIQQGRGGLQGGHHWRIAAGVRESQPLAQLSLQSYVPALLFSLDCHRLIYNGAHGTRHLILPLPRDRFGGAGRIQDRVRAAYLHEIKEKNARSGPIGALWPTRAALVLVLPCPGPSARDGGRRLGASGASGGGGEFEPLECLL